MGTRAHKTIILLSIYGSATAKYTCRHRKEWITGTVAICQHNYMHTIFFSFCMHCQEDKRKNFWSHFLCWVGRVQSHSMKGVSYAWLVGAICMQRAKNMNGQYIVYWQNWPSLSRYLVFSFAMFLLTLVSFATYIHHKRLNYTHNTKSTHLTLMRYPIAFAWAFRTDELRSERPESNAVSSFPARLVHMKKRYA